MDAGIATEDNLALIKSKESNTDYVCVSRTKPTAYSKLTDNATKDLSIIKIYKFGEIV